MSEYADWNAQIMEEFRANGGHVGGNFEGAPMLILHSTGAKTGQERLAPMMYQDVDGGLAIFASKAGAPDNPDWYHNLVANPDASIEIAGESGVETRAVTAEVLQGEARDTIWEIQKERYPGFAEYEEKTDRVIPVVLLRPAG
ncbi:MAG TPA: nitroreductase family deazaflavin-dependent oxidoreductase [Acidimicrobiales bacterium]|nr:nitroreductase family deazaflavin-dependent oxidoreductase [Acidimicrobiales bacterium]